MKFYEILDVPPDATDEQIKAAYRILVQLHHPDRLQQVNPAVRAYAEERLRNKLEYTNVAYSLLPRRFTLTQLQRVYEAILGEPQDKRNFRRRVVGLGIVRETGQSVKEGAHRPAMLYEFSSRQPMVF